jgi:flagellar hook-associated protein 1 FlgK
MVLPGGSVLVSGVSALKLNTTMDVSNRGHLGLVVTTLDGGSPVAIASSSLGGAAGGSIAARDGALKEASDGVDALAFEVANAFNAQHRQGFALDGTDNHDFFTVGLQTGAAATFGVDDAVVANTGLIAAASSATTVPGDASNLARLVATERQALSTGVDATSTLSRLTSKYGNATARAEAVAEQDTSFLEHLTEAREAISGVSVDEEIVNLTKAQRAFEATMKVITTADEMLESLMKIA